MSALSRCREGLRSILSMRALAHAVSGSRGKEVAVRDTTMTSLVGLLLIAALAGMPARADEVSLGVAQQVKARKAWMAALSQCPADVMTWRRPVPAGRNLCPAIGDDACMRKCVSGDAGACYWLAQSVQEKAEKPVSEALFQRACTLGIASGCTNRAAGMLAVKDDASVLACTYRSFERTCALGDAWGCTMQGLQLVRGLGVEPDADEALRVLQGACRNGEDDPACQSGQALRQEIKARK
jgi:TPR repeat protein